MQKQSKESITPIERHETIRQYIVALLLDYTISAKELSNFLKIPEKDVHDHLVHIKKTMNKGSYHLVVYPAECSKCSFVFRKRDKLAKPGKCPICHCNQVIPPLFSIIKYT